MRNLTNIKSLKLLSYYLIYTTTHYHINNVRDIDTQSY